MIDSKVLPGYLLEGVDAGLTNAFWIILGAGVLRFLVGLVLW
jgi:hypothetical protein